MKAKINFLCWSIKLLPLVISRMDVESALHSPVNFKYLERRFVHGFAFFVIYFCLLLLLCWFAPLLQTSFAEDIFCNSDHPCYISLGAFQLIPSTQESWYSNVVNVFQPRSYWHCLELKDYSWLHMPVQHLPFFAAEWHCWLMFYL